MNSCQIRHSFCTERCIMRADNDTVAKSNACISRTCDHQLKSCRPDAGGTRDSAGGRTREKVVRDKRRRLGAEAGTTPAAPPAPVIQARPTTTGSGDASSKPPVVRDHRVQRSGSPGSEHRFGIGVRRSAGGR
jgi:hypothetical protein